MADRKFVDQFDRKRHAQNIFTTSAGRADAIPVTYATDDALPNISVESPVKATRLG